jgi:hypothetical protein
MMYKNVAATLQTIERVQREKLAGSDRVGAPAQLERPTDRAGAQSEPLKLGPLQKVVAFGPLAPG